MKKTTLITLAFTLIAFSAPSLAGAPVAPEIDGSGLFIVLGIVISAVALAREKLTKK